MPRLATSPSRLSTARVVSLLGVSGMSLFLGAADNTCVIRIETPDDLPVCAAIAVECPEGTVVADTDDDGCALECAAVACPEIAPPRCPEGGPIDLDGDGCALECRGDDVICPAIAIACEEGFRPADTNGDGCALECAPVGCPEMAPPRCPDGARPIDRDGDGCFLECGRGGDVICPAVIVECDEGQVLIDRDGDGCALECVDSRDDSDDDTRDGRDGDTRDGRDDVVCPMIAVECANGQAPIDADGDGCALECEDSRDGDPSDGRDAAGRDDDGRDDDGRDDDGRDDDGRDSDGSDDVVCPAIAVECANGRAPIDADGDGCALECAAR